MSDADVCTENGCTGGKHYDADDLCANCGGCAQDECCGPCDDDCYGIETHPE